MFFYALQQFELCFGAHQIMLGVQYFIIGVSVNIVGKETYCLHIRE